MGFRMRTKDGGGIGRMMFWMEIDPNEPVESRDRQEGQDRKLTLMIDGNSENQSVVRRDDHDRLES